MCQSHDVRKNSYGHDMKKRYRLREKENILHEFEKSGLTQANFSKDHDLNAKTLSRWVNDQRMNEANNQRKDELKKQKKKDFCQKAPSLFMPVVIQDECKDIVDQAVVVNPLVCLTLRCKSFSLDIPSSLDDISLLSKIIKELHAL